MTLSADLQAKLYFVIVDRRDASLFQSLMLSTDDTPKWGLRQHDKTLWEQLRRGDVIYMMLEGDHRFSIQGSVSQTEINPDLPKQWGSSFRTRMMVHIVYFNATRTVQIPRHELLDHADDPHTKHAPGLHKIQEHKIDNIMNRQVPVSPTTSGFTVLPIDLNGPPDQIKHDTVRFIRDTKKSRELKTLYDNKCQICEYRLEIDAQTHYSEVHHIWPLHDGGDDDFDNMIVLCPTHHAEFDYGIICVNEQATGIIDRRFNKVGNFTIKVPHHISLKNIKYNLERLTPA